MKAILCAGQKVIYGHNLKDLFGLLPSEVQTDMKKRLSYPNTDFADKLKGVSDIFEECRYTYGYNRPLAKIRCSVKIGA